MFKMRNPRHEAHVLQDMGGGGGGGTSTTVTSNIPDWLQDPTKRMVTRGEALTGPSAQYQQFQGPMVGSAPVGYGATANPGAGSGGGGTPPPGGGGTPPPNFNNGTWTPGGTWVPGGTGTPPGGTGGGGRTWVDTGSGTGYYRTGGDSNNPFARADVSHGGQQARMMGAQGDPKSALVSQSQQDVAAQGWLPRPLPRDGGNGSDNVTCIALEWETPDEFESSGLSMSTETVGASVFASTVQAGWPDSSLEDMDEAAIERSIAEINEAIRRSAARRG